MTEPIVFLTFGAAGPHPDDRAEVMAQLHDDCIAANPVRLGPVEWRWYAASEAAGIVAGATDVAGRRGALGLLAFLLENPDAELCVASVLVPAGVRV